MLRPLRLAVATALLTLIAVVLGGVPRYVGTESAGAILHDAWQWEPAFIPVTAIAYELVSGAAALAMLVTAVAVQRQAGSSSRARRVAWLAAGLQLVNLAGLFMADLWWPAAHVGAPVVGMALIGLTVLLCLSLAGDQAGSAWQAALGRVSAYPRDHGLVWLTRAGLAALLLVVVSGALTGAMAGPLPCSSWPLCVDGGLLPDQATPAVWLHMGHRLLTIVVALLLFAITLRVWTRPSPRLGRRLALALAAVLVVQILLGGNLVVTGGPAWLGLLHLLASVIIWVLTIGLAVLAPSMAGAPRRGRLALADSGSASTDRGPVLPVPVASAAEAAALAHPLAGPVPLPDLHALRALVADYVALMKPGILSLLLVTTFAAMLIAAAGVPPFWLVCVTVVGGVLVAGGANVLNCYVDRDIDAIMPRTRHRASAANRIAPGAVLAFGTGLTVAAVLLLGIGANWVAAGLALAGNLYYVLIYTLLLKRRTPHNVVIGGAAGAVPPLVGWAAVTGDLSPIAWMLFGIIFMWTPPHSWALALLKQGEYGRAAVPMLPVVAGEAATRRQIVIYSVLLAVVCLALVPLGLGPIYLAAAVLINAAFLGLAVHLYLRPAKRQARRLFFGSLWYLALIFLAAVVDRLLIA